MSVEISQSVPDSTCNPQSAARTPLLRWFLVLTKPCAENTAKVNLERQGYRVYHPRLQRAEVYRGRWMDRVVSLFPRYLFIQLDAVHQSLAPVRSTVGVAKIVCFGSETAVVDDTIVDGLMQLADPESGLHRLRQRLLAPGAVVRVISGAFAGLDGIFEREVGEDRVMVLFQLLGREAHVSIPVGAIAAGYAA